MGMVMIPVVTGFIGWVTNVVAVKMLFHPRKPISLGFMILSGVVPRRQKALAKALSEIFEKELLSGEDLAQLLANVDKGELTDELCDRALDGLIAGVMKKIPMAKMFLSDSLIDELRPHAREELVAMMPELEQLLVQNLSKEINLKEYIEEKIRNFSIDQLEAITMHVATKELKTIEFLGGVIGFLVGLLQVGVMYFSS